MVIIYDLNTKEIIRTEDNTNEPILPFNMTLEEKEAYLKERNQSYIILNDEIGAKIYNHTLIFNNEGEFEKIEIKEALS